MSGIVDEQWLSGGFKSDDILAVLYAGSSRQMLFVVVEVSTSRCVKCHNCRVQRRIVRSDRDVIPLDSADSKEEQYCQTSEN